MKTRSLFFPDHCRALRRLGFKRTDLCRSKVNGRLATYEMTHADRKLKVQLWEDGGHRVSHALKGREVTTPTNFRTVEEMGTAINREWTREHRSDLS